MASGGRRTRRRCSRNRPAGGGGGGMARGENRPGDLRALTDWGNHFAKKRRHLFGDDLAVSWRGVCVFLNHFYKVHTRTGLPTSILDLCTSLRFLLPSKQPSGSFNLLKTTSNTEMNSLNSTAAKLPAKPRWHTVRAKRQKMCALSAHLSHEHDTAAEVHACGGEPGGGAGGKLL